MSESEIRAEIKKLREKHFHVNMRQRRSENCFGDYIFDRAYAKEQYVILVAAIKKSLKAKNRYFNFLPDIIQQ